MPGTDNNADAVGVRSLALAGALAILLMVRPPQVAGQAAAEAVSRGPAEQAAESSPQTKSLRDVLAELGAALAATGPQQGQCLTCRYSRASQLEGYAAHMVAAHLRRRGINASAAEALTAQPQAHPEDAPSRCMLSEAGSLGASVFVQVASDLQEGQRRLTVSAYEVASGRLLSSSRVPFLLPAELEPLLTAGTGPAENGDRKWLKLFIEVFPAGGLQDASADPRLPLDEGDYLMQAGLWKDAARTLLAAAARTPNRYLMQGVYCLQLAGDGEGALSQVRALLKRYPDSGPLYALNAWLLLRQKRPDDGLMMLEQARLCDMAHTGLYRYGRGLMAAEQGDRQSAARELAQACDLLPDKLFVQLETARFYGGKTQLDKAIEYYRRATRTSDCSADTWAEMAVALEVAGDADGALAALYRAFQLRNDSLSITRQLAAMLKRKGRHEDALGVLKRAAEANPCKPGLLAAYGDGAAEMWRIGEAQKAFRQSLQADSQFTYGQVRLAAMLRLQRQYAQAESLLKQVLAQQPDYVPALLELARTWQDLGRTEEALSALQQSIERDPAARLFAARLWFEAGDGAEAIRQAQIAVSSRPDAETYVTLSGIFLSSGDTGKAEAAALGAAEKDSFSSAAHLALARAMAAGGKDEPARTETARALELDPYSVEALRFAGNLRAASGDFAGCAELWQRAIDLNPWHAELHRQLARLLSQQLDDSLRAQEHERRYAELEQMRRSAAP